MRRGGALHKPHVPGAPSTPLMSRGAVHAVCVLGLHPLRTHPGHCLHHLCPGAPSTPCTSRSSVHTACIQGCCPHHAHPGALSTPPASWGLCPLCAHPGHCLHHLSPGAPSTPCTSRAPSTPPESWGLRPHCRYSGVLSTLCASWGSIHTTHARGCRCTLRGPRQTASRPPFLSRSGDLGVRSGAGQISIKVKVSQSRELLASILSHF